MKLWLFLSFVLISLCFSGKAEQSIASLDGCIVQLGQPYKKQGYLKKVFQLVGIDRSGLEHRQFNQELIHFKKSRAILMAVLTGPLGGHRLYLGTKPYVPVIYTLTLGGGMGLLPLIDIVVILFTDDLQKYQNCSRIIMWGEE